MNKVINLDPKRRKPVTTPDLDGLTGLARVQPVLAQFATEGVQIVRESTRGDLGVDSLEWVEIMIELEDLLGIDMDADEFEFLTTMGDLADLVDRKITEKTNG